MKRKLVMTIVAIMISVGLIACSSNNSNPADGDEITQEEPDLKSQTEDNIPHTEIDEVNSPEPDNEDIEIIEQDEVIPTWYMDPEGIKNEELGVIIKKENIGLEKLGLLVNMFIEGSGSQWVFECCHYEGDLDTYISEHTYEYVDKEGEKKIYTMEKGKIGNVSYAYGEGEYNGEVVFAGNGIIVSTNFIVGESVENCLKCVESDDELDTDCQAFLSADGLHCPALGIKFSCKDTPQNLNGTMVMCDWDNGATLLISDEAIANMYYMFDTDNAQEVVDKYVEESVKPNEYRTINYSAIDGTTEINIGQTQYCGRGLIGQYDWANDKEEDWLFYSDETTWSISITYDEGGKYQDYISAIEVWE